MTDDFQIGYKIYVNHCGWILHRGNDGKTQYTSKRDWAKIWPSENDKEFMICAREACDAGHHIDKVRCLVKNGVEVRR